MDQHIHEEVSLMEMMDARERRCMLQNRLLQEYGGCLVCLTLNIPGPVKVLPGVPNAFQTGCTRIQKILSDHRLPLTHFETVREKTGYEAFFSVAADADHIKKLMISLEDQDRLGRLFDLDVLRADGIKVSREDLQMPARRCLLCGEAAQICSRSRRHSVAELTEEITRILADA